MAAISEPLKQLVQRTHNHGLAPTTSLGGSNWEGNFPPPRTGAARIAAKSAWIYAPLLGLQQL